MGIRKPRWTIAVITLASLLLAACTPMPVSFSPVAPPSLPNPELVLLEAPQIVCGSATQLRLQVQSSDNVPAATPAAWELRTAAGEPVAQGTWTLRDGAMLVPFPDEAPLPAGDYTVTLRWQEEDLVAHPFSIASPIPTIPSLTVSTVPDGRPVSQLRAGPDLQVLYVNYAFEGGCAGAPYWIVVRDAQGETVCTENAMLETTAGAGTMACYHDDGEPFAAGTYEVEMTLMGEATAAAAFELTTADATATPPPTPTPAPLSCEPLFTASGLTPDGLPYRSLKAFDWYIQGVYIGTVCQNLTPETTWRSAWYLRGRLVREANGTWQAAATEGTVWDSLTGNDANPFLLPGAYTVTLEIGAVSLEGAFNVVSYASATSTEAETTTE